METLHDSALQCERMYSLRDALAQACKETTAMIAKLNLSSDLKLCERKRRAWEELVKQQPKWTLEKRTDAEKKAKRKEKNQIYQDLKKKNGNKPCVQYIKNSKERKAEPIGSCAKNACAKKEAKGKTAAKKKTKKRTKKAKKACAKKE
eukprot:jgi/Mesvir1/16622/Mv10156-RA.1